MSLFLPDDGILRALTIREPFATLVAMGLKTCESRVWHWPNNLKLPMTVAIHASADDSTIGDDHQNAIDANDDIFYALENLECVSGVVGKSFYYSQAIVGLVDVVGCVLIDPAWSLEQTEQELRLWPGRAAWANPPYAFILDNPRRFKTGITARGQVKLWRVDPSIQQHCIKQSRDPIDPMLRPQPLPTKPIGFAKPLGDPNYAALGRDN